MGAHTKSRAILAAGRIGGIMPVEKLTPMMQQYKEVKGRYKDSLLLFRLGDF